MSKGGRIESVGWFTFIALWLVSIVPMTFVAWQITYDDTPIVARVGMGVLLGMFLGALLTWGVNSILQGRARRRMRQAAAERKKSKKRGAKSA
jgi:hypothetical protein